MRVVILDTPADVAITAAEHISCMISTKPCAILGLATGGSTIGLYDELVARYNRKQLSFAGVTSFNLDEYIGLEPLNSQSYRSFMTHHLFEHIDINIKNTHVPNGMIPVQTANAAYEDLIQSKGGIDLQILGIGNNGHIGFNEPGSSFMSRTRAKALTKETIKANSRFFSTGEYQPNLAITMGIGTILDARKIVLIATGEAKSFAVRDMIEGPLSNQCPASALQNHPNVVIVIDKAAAHLLEKQPGSPHLNTYDKALGDIE